VIGKSLSLDTAPKWLSATWSSAMLQRDLPIREKPVVLLPRALSFFIIKNPCNSIIKATPARAYFSPSIVIAQNLHFCSGLLK
jgi:hypothetical protein